MLALAGSLWLASSFPLLDPDEGRNAEVAREMLATRDWVVPHLAGMPYLDKPPGLFWATALSIALGGATPLSARLPAALAAAFTLALLARAAWRRGGTAFALRAVLLLAAAPLFAALSAYVIFDMPLALCVTVVWLGVADEVDEGASAKRRLAMFAALTAGVLLKGPVMIAWAIGGSLGAALMVRSRAPLRWLAWWPGWVLMLGVAGGWFALATRRHPEYPHYAFLEESLERMTRGSFKREQPWWFAPAVLVGGALAWSLATPWGRRRVVSAVSADDALRRERIAVAARVGSGFVLFALVFFTLSHSKLVTYLLPALPPFAWLAAEAWSDRGGARRAGAVTVLVFAALAIACGALAQPAVVPAGLDDPARLAATRLALSFAICAATALLAALLRARLLAFGTVLAFAPLVFTQAGATLADYAEGQSGAALARAIARDAPGARVVFEFCYSPGVDFALGRRSDLVSPLGRETTSTYQARYRDTLIARGQWTPLAMPPDTSTAPAATPTVVVRPARGTAEPAPAGVEIFRDARFVATRLP